MNKPTKPTRATKATKTVSGKVYRLAMRLTVEDYMTLRLLCKKGKCSTSEAVRQALRLAGVKEEASK